MNWLCGPAAQLETAGDVWRELCPMLTDSDIALQTAVLEMSAIHPMFSRVYHVWRPTSGLELWYQTHNDEELVSQEALFGSNRATEGVAASQSMNSQRVPKELIASGVPKAELSLPLSSMNSSETVARFVRTNGTPFTHHEVQLIRYIAPVLSLVLDLKLLRRRSRLVLAAYVGDDPAVEILKGHIQRGDVSDIKAAIMLCDLRGFTELSNRYSSQQLVAKLNEYFDLVVPHILENGGEVLKFIGDGVLAIFPIRTEQTLARDVCRWAFAAGQSILASLDRRNTASDAVSEEFRTSLALHYGEVSYGNIGSGSRLDFTVVGRDVNLVSRIETLSKDLDERLLMSASFAQRITSPLTEVGRYH
ncbi:MAG: adenylate/guanylate cyclase domain-containing protein, partial [Hyphomicrobiaceae bacterium]